MKLLDEYKNKVVHLKCLKGLITFNTKTTPISDYKQYHSLGFDFCFKVDEVPNKAPKKYIGIEQGIKSKKVYKKKDEQKNKVEG